MLKRDLIRHRKLTGGWGRVWVTGDKAQYHLKSGGSEQRTSCRATSDHLSVELERIQNLLGTKQSEADALAVLKKAFRDQKEELLKSIEDIEERTDKERLKDLTRQALQQR